jgi:Ulp1 family protease
MKDNKVYIKKKIGVEMMSISSTDLDRVILDGDAHGWLNDEIINFYLGLLAERENPQGGCRVLVHNSFFWASLTENSTGYNYKKVARWTRRRGAGGEKILGLEYMVIPINVSGNHWTLAIINFKSKRFEYYDSLSRGSKAPQYYQVCCTSFLTLII